MNRVCKKHVVKKIKALYKILRRELNEEQYAKYSLSLTNALLDTGENLNNEEVSCLVEAANV